MAVTGAGSTLNALSSLVVGDPAAAAVLIGTLTVANGGVVNSPGLRASSGAAPSISASADWLARSTRRRSHDGRIVANFTDTLTLAAAISGTGTLSKAGAGTLPSPATARYTGATTVNAGTLSVNGSIAARAAHRQHRRHDRRQRHHRQHHHQRRHAVAGQFDRHADGAGQPRDHAGRGLHRRGLAHAADRTNVTGTAKLAGTVQAVFGPGTYIARTTPSCRRRAGAPARSAASPRPG